MKQKNILKIFWASVLAIILFGIGVAIFNNLVNDVKNAKFEADSKLSYAQTYVKTVPDAYGMQNTAFEIRKVRNSNMFTYQPYSKVNEDWLQNALNIYNNSNVYNNQLNDSDSSYINVGPRKGDIVTLQDVKDYLSNEYNDDGTPKTYLNGAPNNIWHYLDWSYSANIVPAENYDFNQILLNYAVTNPKYKDKTFDKLTNAQKAAISYKFSNPDYNLDLDNPTHDRPKDPGYES